MSQSVDDDLPDRKPAAMGELPDMTPAAEQEHIVIKGVTNPAGFVGLGAMGLPMVACLVRAGHAILACDTDLARLSLVVDTCGDAVHTTPIAAELGTRCQLVFLMLPDNVAVAEVTGALAETMAPGGLIVDLGQSDATETRLLATALAEKGLRLIDAPAIGDPAHAATAILAFLVGGGAADVALARPYLEAMGTVRTHTGDAGSAQEAVGKSAP